MKTRFESSFSCFPVYFKRKLKFLILFSQGEEEFGLITLNRSHCEVNLSHSLMLCVWHTSENLSVVWLETVYSELMKSSLVHIQYSAIAIICTVHGSLKSYLYT